MVNVQGDEPAIAPQLIESVAQALNDDTSCVMATAAHPMHAMADFLNPNMVKVVLDEQQRALYFSRAPIPYPRDWMKAQGEVNPAAKPLTGRFACFAPHGHFMPIASAFSNAMVNCR